MSTEGNFLPRPWPRRAPGSSPLAGQRVLVLDPDVDSARTVAARLSSLGLSAQSTDGTDLPTLLAAQSWDAAVCAPEGVGPDEWSALCAHPQTPVLVFLESRGAGPPVPREEVFAYLPRDPAPDQLTRTIGRALESRGLEDENRRLKDDLAGRYVLGNVVTRDPAMREVLATVESIADTRANVLILGESGTGKTILAKTIHRHSERADRPFVVVNCGSLPETLLESELFGHVRGAFTGAVKDKVGRFEQADEGTIFLDEINSASLDLQVKLLRVIQDKTFERVGDSTTRKVDVRLMAASNQDLEVEIEAGRFREDLYYRIHVVSLQLPALRDRPGDIALLVEHFVGRFAQEYGKAVQRVHPDCLSALAAHPWPGNVRQLENAIERAVLLSTGRELLPSDLGAEVLAAAGATPVRSGDALFLDLQNLDTLPPLKLALEGPEREIIRRALELCSGNRKETAEMLEINRSTLFNKMRKYGLLGNTFGGRQALP